MQRFVLAALFVYGCAAAEAEPRGNEGAPEADGGFTQPPPRADAGETEAEADAAPDATPRRTTIRVHYAGHAGAMAIRGSAGPLSWEQSFALTAVGNDTYEWSTDALGDLEWKPLLDGVWSLGPNYRVAAGATVDVEPRFFETHGQVVLQWPAFTSTTEPSTRRVWVYLPPTYVENTVARFDAVYMHDGQNLFSSDLAFGGNEWQIDETIDRGAADGSLREALVIGIESTARRTNELTPSVDPEEAVGGEAEQYLAMITGELMPRVDAALRTRTGPAHTALLGSSLGGLNSVYAGVHHANVFGFIGALSPSTWWDDRMILGEVAAMSGIRPLRIYVDSGDAGPSNDDVTNTAALAQGLRDVGYQDGSTLKYVVQAGAQHSESYWAQRAPAALTFLLGKP